jgi:hypothetical protein
MTAKSATTEEVRPVSPASHRYLSFNEMSKSDLETAFLRGVTPDIDQLVGWEFRGMNTPAWARLARIKKFVKGFERRDDGVYGYNRPVEQSPLTEAWKVGDKRFGFYLVAPVDPTSRDNAHLHGVLLDYGRGKNSRFDPTQGLRDYLVQVDPRDPNLFLGRAYYALGPLRIFTNFFVLERLREVGDRR